MQFSHGAMSHHLTKPTSDIHKNIKSKMKYRIFSIKCPGRLFQTWPNRPSVYSKPAFNWGPAFINEVFFLLPFYQVDLLSPNL